MLSLSKKNSRIVSFLNPIQITQFDGTGFFTLIFEANVRLILVKMSRVYH